MSNVDEETNDYMSEKKIGPLMEHLYHDLLLNLPADPLQHLFAALEKPITPKLILAGPPAGGKGTQCELIAAKYGVVHISTGDLLREEIRQGTAAGEQAKGYMSKGLLVPDDLIVKLLSVRLEQSDVQKNGWLLDGFPRTRSQAVALQGGGILPHIFIHLVVPDEVVTDRISGRRTDPATGTVYHLEHNPPPAGLAVEQRADDTPEAIAVRLRLYHRNTSEVLQCYHNIASRINGDKDKDVVFEDVSEAIDARVVVC